jgi:tRNA pseudouridine38-40 synthase
VAVAGAGRTDAGVHALGQVASFELPRELPPPDLARALNGLLPTDVRVLEAAYAPVGFHARRSALGKLYRYELDLGPVQVPQRRRYAGHVPFPLDEERVRAAARLFTGRHDFASLASTGSSVKTTVRTVRRSDVAFGGATLTYEVEADGFLRKMVRSLVGGLVAAGRGALDPEALRRALDARDRREWPAPAPSCGLTLVRVDYPSPDGPVLP